MQMMPPMPPVQRMEFGGAREPLPKIVPRLSFQILSGSTKTFAVPDIDSDSESESQSGSTTPTPTSRRTRTRTEDRESDYDGRSRSCTPLPRPRAQLRSSNKIVKPPGHVNIRIYLMEKGWRIAEYEEVQVSSNSSNFEVKLTL